MIPRARHGLCQRPLRPWYPGFILSGMDDMDMYRCWNKQYKQLTTWRYLCFGCYVFVRFYIYICDMIYMLGFVGHPWASRIPMAQVHLREVLLPRCRGRCRWSWPCGSRGRISRFETIRWYDTSLGNIVQRSKIEWWVQIPRIPRQWKWKSWGENLGFFSNRCESCEWMLRDFVGCHVRCALTCLMSLQCAYNALMHSIFLLCFGF